MHELENPLEADEFADMWKEQEVALSIVFLFNRVIIVANLTTQAEQEREQF